MARADCPAGRAAHAEGIRLRDQRQFDAAIGYLENAAKVCPDDVGYQLTLAETLGWAQQFSRSEAVYRAASQRFPDSRRSRVGLAEVLTWQKEFAAAAKVYRALVSEDTGDVASQLALARIEYWLGDYRLSDRDLGGVLGRSPNDSEARALRRELREAVRPEGRIGTDINDDDQPYRFSRSEARYFFNSDPGTRWNAGAGTWLLNGPAGKDDAPFFMGGVTTRLAGLDINASAGLLRFPDNHRAVIGTLIVSKRIGSSIVAFHADRHELLATASSSLTHPSVTSGGASWALSTPRGWLAYAAAERLRYFDHNSGSGFSAYVLAPVIRRDRVTVWIGGALSYRDTDEDRFRLDRIEVRPGNINGSFRYDYQGVYDPYWTPRQLQEGRIVTAARTTLSRVTADFHADLGTGRDKAIAFGPSTGTTPNAPSPSSQGYDRTFHPWNVSATFTLPLSSRFSASLGFGRSVTAFYHVNEIHAALVRRF